MRVFLLKVATYFRFYHWLFWLKYQRQNKTWMSVIIIRNVEDKKMHQLTFISLNTATQKATIWCHLDLWYAWTLTTKDISHILFCAKHILFFCLCVHKPKNHNNILREMKLSQILEAPCWPFQTSHSLLKLQRIKAKRRRRGRVKMTKAGPQLSIVPWIS